MPPGKARPVSWKIWQVKEVTKFFSVLFRGRDLRDNVQKCRWLQARGVSLYKASCKYIQCLEKPSLTYGRHTLCIGLWLNQMVDFLYRQLMSHKADLDWLNRSLTCCRNCERPHTCIVLRIQPSQLLVDLLLLLKDGKKLYKLLTIFWAQNFAVEYPHQTLK